TARVADVTAGGERPLITLAHRERIEARVLILAARLGDKLRPKLGIEPRILPPGLLPSGRLDLAPATRTPFDIPALTYYGERLSARMAYFSMFPIGDRMRANLFCYRGFDGAWARAFRARPQDTVFSVMPGLRRFVGDFAVVGKINMRMVDLYDVD